MNEKLKTAFAKFSVLGVYLLIAFEFLYMASPFAMYFYSVYKPGLSFINKTPFLAWSAGFFMPHLVADTKSSLLSFIPTLGAVLAALGFAVFAVCAIQIYYSKIFRKKAVTGGIYKFIRHPQYASFALCGFGMLLLWPRYLTLFFYVTLLFVYYWLARREEKECIRKFGHTYLQYKEKTGMFFPVPYKMGFSNIADALFSRVNVFVVYIMTAGLSLFLAVGIERTSVRQLYTHSSAEGTWLAVEKTSKTEFVQMASLIQKNPQIDRLVSSKSGSAELILYLLPADMYISEIPMIKPEDEQCHVESDYSDKSKMKIIITRGIHRKSDRILSGNQLLQHTLTLKPIVEVWIDMQQQAITKIIDLPESGRYTNIPEPIF